MRLSKLLPTVRSQYYLVYLALVSVFGLWLAAQGLFRLSSQSGLLNFILLLTLAVVAQVSNISVSVSGDAGITYAISPAISLAVVPLFGPSVAALVEAVTAVSLWLTKPADERTWKKSWRQLIFNIGLGSISAYLAGFVFLFTREGLGAGTLLGIIAPWLLAAIIYDQVNLWLLIGILRLQQGREAKALDIWKDNLWAMPIGIFAISIGGGMLAFAVAQFDWIGAAIFFLPIFLSSFADRVYVRQMQEHMDNLEAIVADRTQELEELMREKDAFLAVLTHDMKTPLTTIGLYADMISKHPELLHKRPHMSQVILRSQQSLTEIVNNILDLEKLQSGKDVPQERETFELLPMIEYVVEALDAQAQEKEIALQLLPGSPRISISADRPQIERVVTNLISNAVKYTPNGGNVCVSLEHANGDVVIEVSDSGYGIPAEEIPYIFEPFRRVNKHKNKAAGTGLGLAITKALVQAHGGDIEVSSEEGMGSSFVVTLPTALEMGE